MNNLLIIYEHIEPSVDISISFFEGFVKKKGIKLSCLEAKKIKLEDLNNSDIVIIIRNQSMYLAELAFLIKQSKRIVISNYDDDFLAIKDFNIRRKLQTRALLKTLNLSDYIIVPNDSLGEKYSRLAKLNKWVKSDTAIQKNEYFNRYYKDSNSINVIYYTNDGISEQFELILYNIIPDIIKNCKKEIIWTFIGTKPKMPDCVKKENIKHIEHLSLNDFRTELCKDYSFGIAPLTSNEFTKRKYFNKFIEFSRTGLPCIYSNVMPYTEIIENGRNGILCDNSAEDWANAFNKLCDVNIRKEIGLNAQQTLRNNFSDQIVIDKLVKNIPELIQLSDRSKYKLISEHDFIQARKKELFYRFIDPISKAIGRYKTEGLMSLLSYTIKKVFK